MRARIEESVIVRGATRRDAEGIAQARIGGWRAAYRGIVPDAFLDDMSVEADLERMNAWAWNAESAPHWVCEVDGRVVGWASMLMPARDASLGEDVAEIVACYVRPALWGRGLGRRLITTALDAARSLEKTALVLWVLADNAPAQRFYHRLGFTLDGARKVESHIPGVMLDVVRMRRSLDSGQVNGE